MKRVTTIQRTVNDLRRDLRLDALEDPDSFCVFNESRIKAFEDNPFLKSKDEIAQLVGVVDNRVIGGIAIIPLEYSIDGKRVTGVTGNWLYVNPEYRMTMYSARVMALLPTLYPFGIGTGGAIVDTAEQIERSLGYSVFNPVDFSYTRIANGFLERRLPALLALILSVPFNVALWAQRRLADLVSWCRTCSYKLVDLDHNDDAILNKISEFIENDGHRFKEVHDVRWLKWVLSHDTVDYKSDKRRLIGLVQGSELVGFFMVNFYSHYCRIVEWQVPDKVEKKTAYFLLRVARRCLGNKNHASIVVDDEDSNRALSRFGFFKKSCGASSVMIAKRMPASEIEGLSNHGLWRTRPAFADAALL